ncbi:hypothetical protein B1756_13975 [Natrarchaeobaculum aegyptiacum]|uniref:Uncharacterized protein n=2 Tax=Natrarchaeobaculum aegyptiacum TaxID=745377 RepID=A0A2Z2HWV9_9EURY|nr:hypothetical protein B1756_13975 [Natrarchaeobaculum aegyptiacum]
MAAFRERQQTRPAEVPHDIEQQTEASLHRNKAAHRDHEPAGEASVPDSVRAVVSEPGQQLEGEMADTEIHVQRFTGAIADIGSTAASFVKFNHEAQKTAQEAEADSYAQMGGTEGSVEERVENLEEQVSELGKYVSEQIRPASTKRQMVSEAGKDVLSSGAGLATGGGIAALGLAGPFGAIAGAALAGAATKGMLDTSPAIGQTAEQMASGRVHEKAGALRDRLPGWLGGRDEDDEWGDNFDGLA